jgi:hypothetical protein
VQTALPTDMVCLRQLERLQLIQSAADAHDRDAEIVRKFGEV